MAQLAVKVAAPTNGRFVVEDGAGVLASSGDGDGTKLQIDFDRYRGGCGGPRVSTVAELALGVAAPAVHVGVEKEGTTVFRSSGDCRGWCRETDGKWHIVGSGGSRTRVVVVAKLSELVAAPTLRDAVIS